MLREAGKNSTWRLPGNGVGDAKNTPGVGAGGNPVRIRTCVNVTFPAAQRVVSLKGYSLASILPWDSLGWSLRSEPSYILRRTQATAN